MTERHLDPAGDAGFDGAGLARLHRAILLAQILDERLVEEARQGALESWRAAGGVEPALVGAASVLGERDWLFAGPLDLAALLERGVSLDVLLSHVFATPSDPTKARALPQRLSLRGTPAIAGTGYRNGAHLTHAAGVAWAAKIRHDDAIALASFDEDELASGEFHNAMNFAGVFKLPVVFVAVRSATVSAGESAKDRGIAYGVPGIACDGGDVLAVVRVVREAALRARRGEGATIVEAVTSADTTSGVSALARLERLFVKRGHDAGELASRETLRALVDDSVARALASLPAGAAVGDAAAAQSGAAQAGPESMFDDVYRTLPWHLAEEREAMRRARR